MITLAKCRELLGDSGRGLSDEDLETLRDQLYGLADVVTDIFVEQHSDRKPGNKDGEMGSRWN